MNRNAVIAVVVIILIGLGIWYFNRNDSAIEGDNQEAAVGEAGNNTATSTATTTPSTATTTSAKIGTTTPQAVKAFSVTASNFKFSPTEIRVKEGDLVRITVKNTSGTHDWKIDEFNAGTKILKSGQEETIEFTANKKGTFEYYCSVDSHRKMGMKGNLIVE